MMALSALSVAHKTCSDNADALEHYQQVIPALQTTVQSAQDSYSDGTLLTHLLLLFYEIAASGQREISMWQHHCDQLLRIITFRRQVHFVDHYDFITWIVYCIDVYALLSASGTGTFVEAVLQQNILPSPERVCSSWDLIVLFSVFYVYTLHNFSPDLSPKYLAMYNADSPII